MSKFLDLCKFSRFIVYLSFSGNIREDLISSFGQNIKFSRPATTDQLTGTNAIYLIFFCYRFSCEDVKYVKYPGFSNQI